MHSIHKACFYLTLVLFLQLTIPAARAQSVGLVLSGGGVRGMAHLGVIKALEEEKIPVDYITGTSAGALVGSMYSIGLTPAQIEKVMTSKDFVKWAAGNFDEENAYYFLKNPDDASWVSIKLIIDSILKTQLPSNVVNAAEIDFGLMERMAGPAALSKYNFDSLLVPFRCVAADITGKRAVVFRKGDLAQAVRASMAFPFYFPPVLLGNNILYDGGIYNNFPTDVMLDDFKPDIILGVSAAGLPEFPAEGNFLSQLKTMITQHTAYTVPRPQDILIEPLISSIGTFEFNSARSAIDSGYAITRRMMPQIKAAIERRTDSLALSARRHHLQNASFNVTIDKILVYGVNEDQANYIRSVLNPRNQCLNLQQLRKNWFQLIADDNQIYIYPRLILNEQSGDYDLHIDVRKNKGMKIDFGGIVSSRPVNTGFVSVQHNFWGQQSIRMHGNFYFGKLYNSAQFRMRLDLPGRLPFYVEPSITLSQYDFYKSSTSFFADVKPSFLVQYERNYAVSLGLPVRNKSKVISGINAFRNNDKYYLTRIFSENDTTDQTSLDGYSAYLFFERNTLNRKMYANEGTHFEFRSRIAYAEEYTRPGSTRIIQDTTIDKHEWFQLLVKYDNYFKTVKWYKAGFYMELNFSSMPFLSTYTASKSQLPAFQPLPEMQTIFLESFRAQNFMGLGLKNIFSISEDFDVRIEGYLFQPFQEILKASNYHPYYGDAFQKRYYAGTVNAVYQSPIGPISLALNYIETREKPFSLMFHLGYLIFNRRSIQ
ncbi:MAG: patatin-like phospholipase family protein [Bacteroidia bacterium]|nr:patatin-like phospholipase family protein [Bacteroidia bacterium]